VFSCRVSVTNYVPGKPGYDLSRESTVMNATSGFDSFSVLSRTLQQEAECVVGA
jgi:hypothetical protein